MSYTRKKRLKNVFKNWENVFTCVQKIGGSVTQTHPDLMVARKLRTAAMCKAPSSGLLKFPWGIFDMSHRGHYNRVITPLIGGYYSSYPFIRQFKGVITQLPKKHGPVLAPLFVFVGVMGRRWYLCRRGWCIFVGEVKETDPKVLNDVCWWEKSLTFW